MPKRYFIRKSHSEIVQEQNRMLQTLIAMQSKENKDKSVVPKVVYDDAVPSKQESIQPEPELESFSFDDDDAPFVPMTVTGKARLPSVNTDKVSFDEEGVEKLKKRKFSTSVGN